MRKTSSRIITFSLFLNLYISLTHFWYLSNQVYTQKISESHWGVLPFIVALLILIRHAQIIEVTFEISKQNDYIIGLLGLTLPIISVIIPRESSPSTVGYLLGFLFIFELMLINPKNRKLFDLGKIMILGSWLVLYLVNQENYNSIAYIVISCILLLELGTTSMTIPAHISDRYDLYMLAYFSVAGVLFNYCSDYVAKNTSLSDIHFSKFLLIIFWLMVLVRIIQSLHLAALDYHDTEIKGRDLLVLSFFYLFITTFWLLSPNQTMLFGSLSILSLLTSCYFLHMRVSRIQKETSISVKFDNRIQSINSFTFAIVCIANAYMYFNGYRHSLFLIQIAILLFNMYHSHRLTMWIKFDLLSLKNPNNLYFEPVSKEDLVDVAQIINQNFGYIYEHFFNTKSSHRNTERLIFSLISCGSQFGSNGRAHYYWIHDQTKNTKVGLICLKAKQNSVGFYSMLSFPVFIVRYFMILGVANGFRGLSTYLKSLGYINKMSLCEDDSTLELSYIVIFENERQKGYFNTVVEILRNVNIDNYKIYPLKKTYLTNITLIVRDLNTPGKQSFKKCGFIKSGEIKNTQFDQAMKQGYAIIMTNSMREVHKDKPYVWE